MPVQHNQSSASQSPAPAGSVGSVTLRTEPRNSPSETGVEHTVRDVYEICQSEPVNLEKMTTLVKSTNIVWHSTHVERSERERILGQQGCTIWFTGLPSPGKSTASFTLEHDLIKRGYLAYVLDGDNVRHGLIENLGFSAEDREDNIRRIGEVTKLFADSGVIVMTSFMSSYRKDRELARKLREETGPGFIEVFVDTPVEICEDRDPKGLYKKARKGELKGFTGVDDPYEAPANPEIVVNAFECSPEKWASQILDYLFASGVIRTGTKEGERSGISC